VGVTAAPQVDRDELAELVAQLVERNRQLEIALESRIVIEQAKGVLIERLDLDPQEAFELLRGAARSNHLRLHDLARRVVESRTTPPELNGRARRAAGG
jgi:AmiR/NasT family two-component response regulator